MASRGEIYSTRSDSERRTYFFNVKENRRGDLFLNIVESSKRDEGESFDRHQIMVYEEDIKGFMEELEKAVAIARKRESLAEAASPRKYKKKTSATHPSPRQKSSGNGEAKATNLQRKKVLKLKKKRDQDT